MTDTRQPTRNVVGGQWLKDKRYGQLTCGHLVEVDPKEAMPARLECPSCPAEPLEDACAA